MRSRRGWTLVEQLIVLTIIGLAAACYLVIGQYMTKQTKIATARNQAEKIQHAMEAWCVDQGPLYTARNTFAALPATSPASQVNFFSTYLAQYFDAADAADVIANSTAMQLSTTAMNTINASCTITWDTNYTANHPKVNLTIP